MIIGMPSKKIPVGDVATWDIEKILSPSFEERTDLREFLPVDLDPERTPKLIHGNQHITVMQSADGDITDIFTPRAAYKLAGNRVVDDLFACRWLFFDLLHWNAAKKVGGAQSAMHWEVLFTEPHAGECLKGAFRAAYHDQVIPKTVWESQFLRCEIQAYAPQQKEVRLRSIVYRLEIQNRSTQAIDLEVRLVLSGKLGKGPQRFNRAELYRGWMVEGQSKFEGAEAFAGFVPLTGQADWLDLEENQGFCWTVNLAAEGSSECAVLIALDDSPEAVFRTMEQYKRSLPQKWVSGTLESTKNRWGNLSIEGGCWWASFLHNHFSRGNATIRVNEAGAMICGAIGPEHVSRYVNREDLVRCLMVHHWLSPDLFREFVLFTCRYMIPPPAVDFVENFQPNIALPIIAEMYYRSSGDSDFFRQHPEIEHGIAYVLRQMFALKSPDAWLFPGDEVSDGHTVKEYDLINNLQAWRALQAAGRLSADVFQKPEEAKRLRQAAENVRSAIFEYMTTNGEYGAQFAAGTDLKTTILFIDGEDNFGAFAPYFGFCDFNDPRWLNYCKQGLSPANPIYDPVTEGLIWVDDPNIGHTIGSPTAPSFASRMAMAVTRTAAQREMKRIERLSDVDTTFYWYPRFERTRGGFVNSMWMAASTSYLVFQHYLGLDIDAPAHHLRFAPWSPWRSFRWENFHFGAGHFSIEHIRGRAEHVSMVTNHTGEPWKVTFGFYLSISDQIASVLLNGAECVVDLRQQPFHEEIFYSAEVLVPAGEQMRMSLTFTTQGVR